MSDIKVLVEKKRKVRGAPLKMEAKESIPLPEKVNVRNNRDELVKVTKEELARYTNKSGRYDPPEVFCRADDMNPSVLSSLKERVVELAKETQGMGFVVALYVGDEVHIYERHHLPCYGELATYKDTHGEKGYKNEYRPHDLYWPFPSGEPIFIAMKYMPYNKIDRKYIDELLSDKSPFISGIGSGWDFIDDVFVMTDMDIDPTVAVDLLMFINRQGTTFQKWSSECAEAGLSPSIKERFFLFKVVYLHSPYVIISGASYKRCTEGPKNISMGTFKDGYGYTRSGNESIWDVPDDEKPNATSGRREFLIQSGMAQAHGVYLKRISPWSGGQIKNFLEFCAGQEQE